MYLMPLWQMLLGNYALNHQNCGFRCRDLSMVVEMSRRLPTCDVATTLGRHHEGSGYKNLVVYVCLNAVMVEFSLTRGIYG